MATSGGAGQFASAASHHDATQPGIVAEAPRQLPKRLRIGYATGSLVTGTFGTVPGLLLLPYLTDTLGVAAGVAGLLVLLPKAWDVLVNPVAGRLSDRTRTRWGARRPYLLVAGFALALLFASCAETPEGSRPDAEPAPPQGVASASRATR